VQRYKEKMKNKKQKKKNYKKSIFFFENRVFFAIFASENYKNNIPHIND